MQTKLQTLQTHSGAVWSGSALFAQTYLSENLGSLWYKKSLKILSHHFWYNNFWSDIITTNNQSFIKFNFASLKFCYGQNETIYIYTENVTQETSYIWLKYQFTMLINFIYETFQFTKLLVSIS